MLKHRLEQLIETHLSALLADSAPSGGAPTQVSTPALKLERPKNADFGDWAVNVSPLSKVLRQAPPAIASALQARLMAADPGLELSCVAGFVNLRLSPQDLASALCHSLTAPFPGQNASQAGLSMLLEFVSANPTGPLHIGHGRWAALGDAIARILRYCGGSVTTEFYINDAGVQMANLANSLYWRACQQLAPDRCPPFPTPQPEQPFPFYPGEYVTELAQAYLAQAGEAALRACWETQGISPAEFPTTSAADSLRRELGDFARVAMLAEQRDLLARFGVPFEAWVSERETLHETGALDRVLDKLAQTHPNALFEADGALWFRATEFGDDKDRVLRKSDGTYTYLTADIAYHDEKFSRRTDDGQPRYNRIVNIWGADHHGYIPRMRAAVQALGHDVDQFEVLLGQLVNLVVAGERTRMGKRKTMLTLADLIDEVGADATRFWMVSKSADTPLAFDVDLAASATQENPVFYAQYAHARCAGILRNATQPGVTASGEETLPVLSLEALEAARQRLTPADLGPLFDRLDDPQAPGQLKALILRLDGFEDLLADAARLRAPHLVARYVLDLASDFHSFYVTTRVLTDDPALTQVRLMVVLAVQRVLATALGLLGVSAPESM